MNARSVHPMSATLSGYLFSEVFDHKPTSDKCGAGWSASPLAQGERIEVRGSDGTHHSAQPSPYPLPWEGRGGESREGSFSFLRSQIRHICHRLCSNKTESVGTFKERRFETAAPHKTAISNRRSLERTQTLKKQHAGSLRCLITLLIGHGLTVHTMATTLQQEIDAAAPGETINVVVGVHSGPIIIGKPITLAGEEGAEIRGNGTGNVVTISAEGVTLRGLRVTGSGVQLFNDDAGVFVTGNHVRIEHCFISDSLHGIYLKKISGAQIVDNRIQGKTTLRASSEPVEKTIGQSEENCDTTLVSNRRGNGIHQWNCDGNLIKGNEISDARDGIYFSFTNNSTVETNYVHHTRYGLHYMYSDANRFEHNTFSENAAGAAIMFSRNLVVHGNRFVNNRGHRAYGLIFQSSDQSRLEQNEITENAVGLSFNQCNSNAISGNRVTHNYIGLRFGSNSDSNRFTENIFARNLHPVETGASDVTGNHWAVGGVGNFWGEEVALDLDRDGINDLPHRELDLLGLLRRDFPAVAFLSDSPALQLLRFANERAVLPGMSAIEDPAPLNGRFWKIRAQRSALATVANDK